MQILEGEQNVVTQLLAHIRQDTRHTQLTVITEQPVAERVFTAWSRAWISPDASEVARWAQRDGTTALADVRETPQRTPARLPAVMEHIVQAIGDN